MTEERNNNFLELRPSESVRRLDFDEARVVPGFVTGTYILIVSGEKPYLNMQVELVPRIYVRQPEWWGFEVVGSIPGGIGLPAFGRYTADKDITSVTGTKGVEVFGTDYSLKLPVPPTFDEQLELSKKGIRGLAQLCNERGDVEYRANQVGDRIYLIASGNHGTLGYKTFFEQALIDVFPPQFILKHISPSVIVPQVITPFVAVTEFLAKEQIEEIVVHDAQGSSNVPVDQTPD